jgi:hypothetical protein
VVFLDFLRFNYPSQNLPVPILEANWWRGPLSRGRESNSIGIHL